MVDHPSRQARAAMANVTKRFGRVDVLTGVDFRAYGGEVHVLAGANGAGKSTLLRILSGALRADDGEIAVDGRTVAPRSPLDAAGLGIAMIHQELSLVGTLSVADNLLLGREPRRCGFVRKAAARAQVQSALARIGLADLDPSAPVGQLPLATQQLVEIAKALCREATVLILDEPTSALPAPAVQRLFALLHELKARDCAIVYVTHRMAEIDTLADRITVLRDGRVSATGPAGDFTQDALITAMLGSAGGTDRAGRAATTGETLLEVRRLGLRVRGQAPVDDVRFTLARGEILGIAGLPGCGAAALLASVCGAFGEVSGETRIRGAPVRIASPRSALAHGIAYVPGDRKEEAILPSLSVEANLTLASLGSLARGGWRDAVAERASAAGGADAVRLTGASLEMPIMSLSGGNQQKVVVGRALLARPRVLLLDEPSRGIDVGARRELHALLRSLADDGVGVAFTSTDLDEVLELADRVLVMHRGRLVGAFARGQATPQQVLCACMGQAAGLAA